MVYSSCAQGLLIPYHFSIVQVIGLALDPGRNAATLPPRRSLQDVCLKGESSFAYRALKAKAAEDSSAAMTIGHTEAELDSRW